VLQASFLKVLDKKLVSQKATVKIVTLFLIQESYYIMYQMFYSLKKSLPFVLCTHLWMYQHRQFYRISLVLLQKSQLRQDTEDPRIVCWKRFSVLGFVANFIL